MVENVKPQHLPVYVWEPIPDPVAQPDRAWCIKRGGSPVAWAFERDQTGLGHGWCVQIGTVEKSGVAMTFEQAKLRAELALDQLSIAAIYAATRLSP